MKSPIYLRRLPTLANLIYLTLEENSHFQVKCENKNKQKVKAEDCGPDPSLNVNCPKDLI